MARVALTSAGLKVVKDRNVFVDSVAPVETGSVTSASLLDRVRSAQPEGWRRLVSLYGPLVYAWCRKAGLQDHDAADVVQNVFQSVLKGINDFRRDRPGDSFRRWLRTVTRNKVRDFWRAESRAPQADGGTEAPLRLTQWPDAEEPDDGHIEEIDQMYHRALELVRAEFEDRTWQAFWRVVVDARPAADVANELNMSPNAVYIAKSRVVTRLRAEFGELLDSP